MELLIPNYITSSALLLKECLKKLIEKNKSYSLRAFAKNLGLSPGGLSQIIGGKKRISLNRAHDIAQKIPWTKQEKDIFLLIVQLETTKSVDLKFELLNKIIKKSKFQQPKQSNLNDEKFKLMADWCSVAILEMISNFASKWDTNKIGAYLNISKKVVEVTIERLIKIGIIELQKNGSYKRLKDHILLSSDNPNTTLQLYYESCLEQIKKSIRNQTPKEKVIGTEVMAFDPDQLDEVRSITDDYFQQLCDLSKQGKNRTHIYQSMAIFYRLNQSLESASANKINKTKQYIH